MPSSFHNCLGCCFSTTVAPSGQSKAGAQLLLFPLAPANARRTPQNPASSNSLGPSAKLSFLLGADKIVYFVPPFIALANCGRIRVLRRLIRSYCLMASASDCLGRLDKNVLACSCCCRWYSFR